MGKIGNKKHADPYPHTGYRAEENHYEVISGKSGDYENGKRAGYQRGESKYNFTPAEVSHGSETWCIPQRNLGC